MPWVRTGCRLVMHHPFDLDTFLEQVGAESITHSVSPPAILTQLLLEPDRLAKADLSIAAHDGVGLDHDAAVHDRGLGGPRRRDHQLLRLERGSRADRGPAQRSRPGDARQPAASPGRSRPADQGARSSTWSPSGWSTSRAARSSPKAASRGSCGSRVRSSSPATGAAITPGDPAARSTSEGYFMTGDVFEYLGDRRQYVSFLGRSKELIVRGGFKISPADIEGMVQEHPAVAEVAAVGAPDPVLGERVCLFVVLRDGPDGDAGRDSSTSCASRRWPRSSCPSASRSSTNCPAARSARSSSAN